jgi:cbb3-type cytochrome oxidase subunit 3
MSETLLLLLLIALSLNFVLGLWFAFKPQVLVKKEKEPVKVIEKDKEESKEEVVWEPGWVARAGPPPFQSETKSTDTEPFAYMGPMDYAPLF